MTTSTAAQLRAVSGVTAGLVALLVAARGGRFPLIRLLNGGLALLAIGALGSAVAPPFVILLLAQVPVGLGLALVLSSGLAAADAWSQPGEGAKTLSWALVGQPVAWIVGQPVVGAVASVDWRWTWVAIPLASAVVAMVAVAMRRASASRGLEDCDPVGLLRLPHVKNWMFGELMAFSAWAGTLVFAGAFFIETYDPSVGATGVILGLVAAVYVPGNFLGRRLLQRGPGGGVLLVSALSLAVGAVALAGLQIGLVYSVVILSVLGFLAGMRTIAGASVGLRLADGRRLAERARPSSSGISSGPSLAAWSFRFGVMRVSGWCMRLCSPERASSTCDVIPHRRLTTWLPRTYGMVRQGGLTLARVARTPRRGRCRASSHVPSGRRPGPPDGHRLVRW